MTFKKKCWGFPGGPVVKTPRFHRRGLGVWRRETRRNKVGRGGGTLSWAFKGASGLYFLLETEATEKFMHEGPRSDLPLEAADATREQ